MTIIQCPGCAAATDDVKQFCGLCGTSLHGRATPQARQTIASSEANARLAAGKRLRTEDRAVLLAEAQARGEHVSGFEKVTTGIALWAKLGAAVCALILMCIFLYACVAAAIS